MSEIQGMVFPPEIEEMAIKLAALDIIRQLYKEEKISEEEWQHVARKHADILAEK